MIGIRAAYPGENRNLAPRGAPLLAENSGRRRLE